MNIFKKIILFLLIAIGHSSINQAMQNDDLATSKIRKRTQGSFACPECGKIFSQRSSLRTHMHHHTGIKVCSCSCKKRYTKNGDLKKHLESNHFEGAPTGVHVGTFLFRCSQRACVNYIFKDFELAAYLQASSRGNPFKELCDTCKGVNTTFQTPEQIPIHIEEESQEPRADEKNDELMNAEMSNLYALAFAAQQSTPTMPLAETHLPQKRKTTSSTQEPIADDQENTNLGNNGFASLTAASLAIEKWGPNEFKKKKAASTTSSQRKKAFECTLCDRSFSQNAKLKDHIRDHTGEKPCQCSCNETFKNNKALKSHLQKTSEHTGSFVYDCQCGEYIFREFTLEEYLKQAQRGTQANKGFCKACSNLNGPNAQTQVNQKSRAINQAKETQWALTLKKEGYLTLPAHNRNKRRHDEVSSSSSSSASSSNTPSLPDAQPEKSTPDPQETLETKEEALEEALETKQIETPMFQKAYDNEEDQHIFSAEDIMSHNYSFENFQEAYNGLIKKQPQTTAFLHELLGKDPFFAHRKAKTKSIIQEIKKALQQRKLNHLLSLLNIKDFDLCEEKEPSNNRSKTLDQTVAIYHHFMKCILNTAPEHTDKILFNVANIFFNECFNPKNARVFGLKFNNAKFKNECWLLYAVIMKSLVTGDSWKNWSEETLRLLKQKADEGNRIVYVAGGFDIAALLKYGIYNIDIIDPVHPVQQRFHLTPNPESIIKGEIGDRENPIFDGDDSSNIYLIRKAYAESSNTIEVNCKLEKKGQGASSKKRKILGTRPVPMSQTTWAVISKETDEELGTIVFHRRFCVQEDFNPSNTILLSFNEFHYISTGAWGIDTSQFTEGQEIFIKQLHTPLNTATIENMRMMSGLEFFKDKNLGCDAT